MKKIVLTAVAATMFAAPAMARPPQHAPAHGWRAQQYAQNYQQPRYYNDGRAYYGQQRAYNDGVCRKDSNTGGTVLGALAGGVAGNVIAGRGDKTLGTVIGVLGGGIAGRELDKRKYSCR
ncbi:glycine zipper 2TM domain-containing protein [Sphingoaurantiacus capsulatus]|uniref:17 kDa surface antigen n=1 Tax=Sphingoaurantiacus capsulatus TaxID=1771310 RepID=A0ABV7XAK0_9SPHN